VRKIVEGHGGTVHIENGPKNGAQVTVTLPVGEADRAAMTA
jgi:signal transduction histidine kinase